MATPTGAWWSIELLGFMQLPSGIPENVLKDPSLQWLQEATFRTSNEIKKGESQHACKAEKTR